MKQDILLVFFLCSALCSYGQTPAKEINTKAKSDSAKKSIFQILQIQNYEENLIGYSFDNDDDPYLDFTFSASTNVFPFDLLMNIIPKKHRPDLNLHFAFTARFGQYIGTRYSNPVIEKRFNPFMFLQYRPKHTFRNTYLQTGYGHESNGQAIDDSLTFYTIAGLPHNDVDKTKDNISRGWDYVGLSVITNYFPKKNSRLIIETNVSLKYYLNKGLLQGTKEEYHDWETGWSGPNYSRNQVNGISLTLSCFIDSSIINKLQIGYETGIQNPFMNNSVKLLVGFKIWNFPFAISYRYGYNGDLAQYGKENGSFGISAIIPSFVNADNKRKY